ncbi:PD40 domain-containing protein [Candidatus Poribacteria bacterium]|nr:PD40 domain-containing protein [Candidatus Poribacteria bacterium]
MQITHTEPGDENQPVGNYCPAYSPDGTKIVFNRRGKGSADTLFVMDTDGKNLVQLTSQDNPDYLPNYSPDGQKIVFTGERDGNADIYVIDANGRNRTQLTNDEHRNWYASYSPDGKYIVCSSDRNGIEDIWIMENDGSNKKKLTSNDNKTAHGPAFSPDGKTILFMSDIQSKFGEKMQIWTMDVNGKNLTCLTSRDAYHSGVDYSPDGRHIAYKSNWDGFWNIYVMDADGSNIVQVTHETGEDLNTRGGWKQ